MPRTSGVDSGHDRAAEPEPQRLGRAAAAPAGPGGSRRRDRSRRRRSCRRRRRSRCGRPRSRARPRDRRPGSATRTPPGDARVHVVVARARCPRALLQHRDEHREPVAVERLRDRGAGSARRSGATSDCTSTHSGRVPSITAVTTEPVAPARRSARNSALGSVTGTSPVVGHLHEPELVGRAEAVLQRAQHAQRVMTVAFERQHGVDDVLERARARRARRPW